MSSNMQRLGDTLTSRMKKTSAAAVPTAIELGTIGSNLSLTTDSIPIPIPKGDYMVNLMLTGSRNTSKTAHNHTGGSHAQYSGSGSHTHTDGEHSHTLPDEFHALREGDRVLVSWCGNDPVVIAVVGTSTVLTPGDGSSDADVSDADIETIVQESVRRVLASIPEIVTVTQVEYDELEKAGEVKPETTYLIVRANT